MTAFGDDVLVISDPSDETPGGIYVFDGAEVEVIDRVSTSGIALAGDDRLLRLLRSFDEAGSSGELLVYDRRGIRAYHRLDDVPDSHDVAWDGSRYVVVATATNRVVWYDESGRATDQWQADGEGDAWHLNNLFLHDGKVYLGAFGRFAEHRGWGGRTEGAGLVLTVPGDETVISGLTAPHNPRLVDGRWLVCNSGTGELLEFDRSGQTRERSLALRTWPRGLAQRGRLLYVGESQHRLMAAGEGRATIAVVDLDAWQVIDRIEMPGREIYDLLLVPRTLADGLTTGFRTNTYRSRATRQLGMFEEVGVEPTRLWAVGEPLPAGDRRLRITAAIPERLPATSTVDVECSVENLGGSILVSASPNPVYLTYRWRREADESHIAEDPLMSPLPRAFRPARSCGAPCRCGRSRRAATGSASPPHNSTSAGSTRATRTA